MNRIRGELTICNHSEAVQYFRALIVDLKLALLNEEHEEITMERLNEGTKHIRDIQQCQRVARIVR